MKKKLLWILPVILVIAVAVSVFAFGKIGFCGERAMWAINSDTLILFGKGSTDRFSENDAPWTQYADKISCVRIGKDITGIGENIFSSLTSLESVFVHEENGSFCSDESGVLFTKDMSTLVLYPKASVNSAYTVPDSVSFISISAFSDSANLTEITLPDSLGEIGSHAFSGCIGLETIVIPDGVTGIGTQSFYFCKSLKSIVIPGSVRSVSVAAFSLCNSVTDIYFVGTKEQWETLLVEGNNNWTVPEIHFVMDFGSCGADSEYYITRERTLVISGKGRTDNFLQGDVPWNVFCDKILAVSVGDGITGLGDYIFSSLSRVNTVNIPKSVTYIGAGAFDGFTKDQSINITQSPEQNFSADWQSGCEATVNYTF
ncbi:MAG: leucine-rich repeat protein [Clostridia bacterium]|nr:leucine-rich repeat protein [Clostridia bacterium]